MLSFSVGLLYCLLLCRGQIVRYFITSLPLILGVECSFSMEFQKLAISSTLNCCRWTPVALKCTKYVVLTVKRELHLFCKNYMILIIVGILHREKNATQLVVILTTSPIEHGHVTLRNANKLFAYEL